MRIIRATFAHLQLLTPLFHRYRVFYKHDNYAESARFIGERLKQRDSLIFLATDEKESKGMGFVQIYPNFSSVRAVKGYTLNDLFVDENCRRAGVARALLEASRTHAIRDGISKIVLETAPSNAPARKLYESLGYREAKESAPSEYLTYSLDVSLADAKLDPQKQLPKLNRAAPPKGVVVITGITMGLGRAMLDRFHEMGWAVAGCARSIKEIEKLNKQFNGQHYFEVVDVSNAQAVKEWGEKVLQVCGVPQLVINNASIVNKPNLIEAIPDEEFAAVMDINLNGSVYVIQSFLPAMKEKSVGTIINISSYWGRFAEEKLAPYCASKFGLEGLTSSVAKELPKGMAIVALDPRDGIATTMLDKCAPNSVKDSPTPDAWSRVAVPYMLGINASHNGQSLTCPPVPTVPKKKVESNPYSFWLKTAAAGAVVVAAVGIASYFRKTGP